MKKPQISNFSNYPPAQGKSQHMNIHGAASTPPPACIPKEKGSLPGGTPTCRKSSWYPFLPRLSRPCCRVAMRVPQAGKGGDTNRSPHPTTHMCLFTPPGIIPSVRKASCQTLSEQAPSAVREHHALCLWTTCHCVPFSSSPPGPVASLSESISLAQGLIIIQLWPQDGGGE